MSRLPVHEMIEKTFLEAAAYERKLPQVRAPGYKSWWPPMSHDPVDYGYQVLLKEALTGLGQNSAVYKNLHVAPRKDIYDLVMLDWLGPNSPLDLRQKSIIWMRTGSGKLLSWRKIAKPLRCSHEKVRGEYTSALILLAKALARKNDLTKPAILEYEMF